MENHSHLDQHETFLNFDDKIEKIHEIIKDKLTKYQYKIYKLSMIENMDEQEIVKKLKFTNLQNGVKEIKKQKKNFEKVIKEIIEENDIIY